MAFLRILMAASCLAVLLGPLTASAAERKRFALVVGVNDDPVAAAEAGRQPLTKAAADVRRVQGILSENNRFQVKILDSPETTKRAQIEGEWLSMLERMSKDIEKEPVVLFYFAGHGLEHRGQNYLVAHDTDRKLTSLDKLRGAVSLQWMLDQFARLQKRGAIGIFIVDACREAPRVDDSASAVDSGADSEIKGGVGPVHPGPDIFVLYSAGIGQLAYENPDAENSVFASQLLPLLERRDLALSDIAETVRREVILVSTPTGTQQSPAYYDQLSRPRRLDGDATTSLAYYENIPFKTDALAAGQKLRRYEAGDTLIECAYCPEMVVVGKGTATIGTPDGLPGAASERPARQVDIPRRFAISKHEVTVRDWNACAREKIDGKSFCDGERTLSRNQRALHPVADVTWNDAKRFAEWVTRKTGDTYRLPTEAEWEYAARGCSPRDGAACGLKPYSFGDGSDPTKICLYANGADLSLGLPFDSNLSCDDRSPRGPAQVGSYLPNAFGIFDMHGNVWEWVADCWRDSYADVENGQPWKVAADGCKERVARGGSWRSGPAALRSAVRHKFPETHSRGTLGFRLVRPIAEHE